MSPMNTRWRDGPVFSRRWVNGVLVTLWRQNGNPQDIWVVQTTTAPPPLTTRMFTVPAACSERAAKARATRAARGVALEGGGNV